MRIQGPAISQRNGFEASFMKKLSFLYRTEYTFDAPISNHSYTLKIYPREGTRQQIMQLVEMVSYGENHSYSTDMFGNKTLYGNIAEPHNHFSFEIHGVIEVSNREADRDKTHLPLFAMPSAMTKPTPYLQQALDTLKQQAKKKSCYSMEFHKLEPIEKALYLSDCCHELLEYQSNVTDISTDATEALRLGKGVCQDYAHLLIAFLRMVGIPARYVVGFMMGEGFTHAWVEAFCDGMWTGLDPTNSRLIREDYIKLSHGRDYLDTVVCKGHFTGVVHQQQEIVVQVSEYQDMKGGIPERNHGIENKRLEYEQ